jgi:hypothetical protein
MNFMPRPIQVCLHCCDSLEPKVIDKIELLNHVAQLEVGCGTVCNAGEKARTDK